jgi:hypothetical protein
MAVLSLLQGNREIDREKVAQMRRGRRRRVWRYPFENIDDCKKSRFFSKTILTFLGSGFYKPDIDGVAAD